MSKTKIVLNYGGVRSLLKSSEMMELCEKQAETIKNKCGKGYETNTYTGKSRVNASVGTETLSAMLDNSENNTILKNLRGKA